MFDYVYSRTRDHLRAGPPPTGNPPTFINLCTGHCSVLYQGRRVQSMYMIYLTTCIAGQRDNLRAGRRYNVYLLLLVTGLERSLSLKPSDTGVHEPQIRARLGTNGFRIFKRFFKLRALPCDSASWCM